MTLEIFREERPEAFARWQNQTDLTFQFPGGEQRAAFYRRVAQALDDIVTRHPRDQVAVIAHGGTLRAGLAHLFPDTMSDWWAYDLDNASLTHVHVSALGSRLVFLNDCQHLQARS
jgi:alpha-ribazole phosphatase/probable phosphoglycerate mutase